MEKFPEAICIEKEPFYFIGDPHTECSATAFVAATITTEDAESPNSFLSEIQLVVSFEKSVSIQRPGVLAVRTRRAFEHSKPPIPLLLRRENPHRQNEACIRKANEICLMPFNMRLLQIKRGGVEARYRRFLEKRVARRGMKRRGNLYRITAVTIVLNYDINSVQKTPKVRSDRGP